MPYSFVEIKELNQILKNAGISNRCNSIYVDNLHTPYTEADDFFILPSSSVFHVDFEAAKKYIQILVKYIPFAVKSCNVLAEHRPKRETGKITLFRDFEINDKKFLYIANFHVTYLGGSELQNIIEPPVQERTATVKTSRIYFFVKIVPLEHLITQEGIPINFKTRQYQESLTKISTSIKNPLKESISELFDEVDYSEVIDFLKGEWKIKPEYWKPGRIFNPLTVEYYTVAFRFLDLDQEKIIHEFSKFYQLAESLFSDNINGINKSVEEYHNWLNSFTPNRILSPSGNMSWKINRN